MKWIKRILAVCSFVTLLNVSSVLGVTIEKTIITEDKENCYKTYLVENNEQNNFIDNIEKNIEVDGNQYIFEEYIVEGGITTDTIDISTTKNITSNTNNLESIIKQLRETINYNQDGYIGEYLLDTDNIQIKTNYNGFREDLIEQTSYYSNLSRNDLDFVPKQIVKDGLTLDLLTTEWKIQTTKTIGKFEVPDLYTAKCYYAGKQRIDYPNTYSITARYQGKATKEISNPYKYTIKYKKAEENKSAPVQEKENNIILPAISGTTSIIIVVLFFFTKNVTVYNYRDGKYIKVGKTRMNRNNTINLTRFSLFETTNKYKIEFNKSLTNKMKGKMITIVKGNNEIKMLVTTNIEKYSIEARI